LRKFGRKPNEASVWSSYLICKSNTQKELKMDDSLVILPFKEEKVES
jgi:hypothetical protein